MKKFEIIHLRLLGGCPRALIEEIRQSIVAGVDSGSVRIYRHATVPSDLGICIHLGGDQGDARPSELGVHLAAALREHGIVEHTVWLEEPRPEEGRE